MNIDKILYLIEEENNYLIKKSFFKLSWNDSVRSWLCLIKNTWTVKYWNGKKMEIYTVTFKTDHLFSRCHWLVQNYLTVIIMSSTNQTLGYPFHYQLKESLPFRFLISLWGKLVTPTKIQLLYSYPLDILIKSHSFPNWKTKFNFLIFRS